MNRVGNLLRMAVGGLLLSVFARGAAPNSTSHSSPPKLAREFRGMWVATIGNVDWPSRPGLPVTNQQAEMRDLFDLAVRLHLNAIIFQVRPCCDALYDSPFEPWSEYLTGRMGQAPRPYWDPLKFAIDEAHARGLELHAWFNPFRARSERAVSLVSANHICLRQPQLVRTVGTKQWLDPGEPEAREHVVRVITDVVRRYDVDGIHLDDYFYPYPEIPFIDFPDDRPWLQYRKSGGELPKDDWRRANIDSLVQGLGVAIHREKPAVKFGVSPFGIWRPGQPASVRGLDAYAVTYSDARKWLQEGWVDYLSPQLYWTSQSRQQSFPALLDWWSRQNTLKRHLWPGVATARIGEDRNAGEIATQLRMVRRDPIADGVIFWNASSLRQNRGGVSAGLEREFAQPALVPASPWLVADAPTTPRVTGEVESNRRRLALQWTRDPGGGSRWYILQSRVGSNWKSEIHSGTQTERVFDTRRGDVFPDEVVLTPVGRTGVEGVAARWVRARPTAANQNPNPAAITPKRVLAATVP